MQPLAKQKLRSPPIDIGQYRDAASSWVDVFSNIGKVSPVCAGSLTKVTTENHFQNKMG
jgi:hypothetical protein